jgi:hypothetical protein
MWFKREPVADLLRDAAARRQGGLKEIALELVAAGHMNQAQAERRLHQITTGIARDKKGNSVVQELVSGDTVDKILSALDRHDLWSELEEAGAFIPPNPQTVQREQRRKEQALLSLC